MESTTPLNAEGISYPSAIPRSPLQTALQSAFMDKFNEWRTDGLKLMRPWMAEFFNRDLFHIPDSLAMVQNRLTNNLTYFQANYMIIVFIFLILTVYVPDPMTCDANCSLA